MTLDPTALEIFKDVLCEQSPPWGYSPVYKALQAYLDAADLVERKTLDANTLGHMVDEKLFHLEAERDEARREAEELKSDIATYIQVASDQAGELVEQGKQIAALREVLADAARVCSCCGGTGTAHTHPDETEVGSSPGSSAIPCPNCTGWRAVLTDTAAAAAPKPEATP